MVMDMDFLALLGLAAGVIVVVISRRKKNESKVIPPPIPVDESEETPSEILPQRVRIICNGAESWGELKKMPQGLQVFDEKGKIILDVSDRLTRIVTVLDLPNDSTVTYSMDLNPGEKWWLSADIVQNYWMQTNAYNWVGVSAEETDGHVTFTFNRFGGVIYIGKY